MNTYYKKKYLQYKEKYINFKKNLFGGCDTIMKKKVNAILLPHAGLFYVKQIMDYIFDNIDFDNIVNIILLSTNHFSNENLYFSSYDDFEKHQLKEHSPISIKEYINKKTVKIEIFLITNANEINANEIISKIISKINSEKTLLIANTDLLHCGNSYNNVCPDDIDKYNRKIIHEIITTYDTTNKDICGYNVTKMFLYIIRNLNYKFVEYVYNSSDKINNNNNNFSSVGYVGIIFNKIFNKTLDLSDYIQSNKYLLDLPQKYLDIYFNKKPTDYIPTDYIPTDYIQDINNSNYIIIDSIEGIFVTIYKCKKLRGCIGTFTLKGDVINTIKIQTRDSAFCDSRFTPLTKEEFNSGMLTYTINFLRKPFITQNIFNDFITGLHGITIYFNNRSATYLALVMIESFDMKIGDKINQDKFNKIKESLQQKADTNDEITKIELYECIEVP